MNTIKLAGTQGEFELVYGSTLNYKQIKSGMLMSASYNKYNQGTDYVRFNHFAVEFKDMKHDKVFHSWKEVQDEFHYPTLTKMAEAGYDVHMDVTDLNMPADKAKLYGGDSGDWYYEFEGRFCRGSGAETLSFVELITLDDWHKLEQENAEKERVANIQRRIRYLENTIATLNDELVFLKGAK